MKNCGTFDLPHTRSLAGYHRVIAELPLTIRPSVNQMLAEWDTLFPFEQSRLVRFLDGIESLPPNARHKLLQPLRNLEARMGIGGSDFSERSNTLENASMLARSQFYPQWRRSVDQIFEAVNAAQKSASPRASRNRVLILVLPAELPFGSSPLWAGWQGRGHELAVANSRALVEFAVRGSATQQNLASLSGGQGCSGSADLWLIDAGIELAELSPPSARAQILSYPALEPFRDRFLAGLNSIPKDITASDQVIADLRRRNWDDAWGGQLSGESRLRAFVIDLFLSGNGALIFPSAFVEWSASEVLRRARPRYMVARFGMRAKPKPFTSIAIFENQQTINKLPNVEDPENSAIDSLILARYIWLAASRFPESDRTLCICVLESRNQAYVIAPSGTEVPFTHETTADELYSWIAAQITA